MFNSLPNAMEFRYTLEVLRSAILYLCADITSLLNFLNFLLVSYNRNPLTHDYIVHMQPDP